MHNHSPQAFNITNQLKQLPIIKEQKKQQTSQYPRLAPRSGELHSPRRKLDNLEQGPIALVRVGELSSPERGILSLKTMTTRLSDSSRRRPWRTSTSLT